MNRHTPVLVAGILSLACATILNAQNNINAQKNKLSPKIASSPTATAFERTVATAIHQQARIRSAYPAMFAKAYKRYPSLPRGILESVAYTETGWVHVKPDPAEHAAGRHMPAAYGIMGLYRGEGFSNQVAEGAGLIGVSQEAVINDPQTNILAAAALLDRALRTTPKTATTAGANDAAMATALAAYAGYGTDDSNIKSFARQSFAYNVLQSLERGVSENGIKIAPKAVVLDRAFKPAVLKLLRAPALVANVDKDQITVTSHAALAGPAATATDYPGAIWNPAYSGNYSTAYNSTSAVIMHTIEGSYAGGISWFRNPSANVSGHYIIRKSDGQVTQMVRETHQAWHAKYHNSYTIGIEHDGYASRSDNWSTAMVNSSAALTKSICARRGVNCASAWKGPGYNTWHVVPDSVRIKGHGMLTNNQNRYDPGAYFPWANFYNLINGGGGSNRTSGDFYAIHRNDGGQTSVHLMPASDHFRNFALQTKTALHATDSTNWDLRMGDFNGDGKQDLYAIYRFDQGRTAIHVLDGATNYQTFLMHALSPLPSSSAWKFDVGDFNADGRADVYAIYPNDGGTTAVHILDAASNFSRYSMQTKTAIHETADPIWVHRVGDFNADGRADLWFLHRNDNGRTAVHVLDAASNFQAFTVHTRSSLQETSSPLWELDVADFDRDKKADLYAFYRNDQDKTAAHVLSASSNFQSFVSHALSSLPQSTDANWTLVTGE